MCVCLCERVRVRVRDGNRRGGLVMRNSLQALNTCLLTLMKFNLIF
jgi:hypothetical protein